MSETLSKEASEANHGALSDLWGAGPNMGTERLVALLLSEHPIHPRVRKELAEALSGTSEWGVRMRLEPRQMNKHRDSPMPAKFARHMRDWAIGREVEAEQAAGSTYFEAVATVADARGLSGKTVEAALTKWRRFVRNRQKEIAEIENAGGWDA